MEKLEVHIQRGAVDRSSGRHLLRGTLLSHSDVESARHVTIINQTLART